MIDETKRALRMYRFWLRKLESLGVNVNGVNAKEDEKGKETFPPAPPIEKRAKGEENAPHRGRAREDERAGLFEQFWAAYPGPRKRCKQKCRDKVFALLADPATRQANFARLMAGLNRWKRHDTWMRDGGRFIQGPLVWLNNEDWNAEIAVGPLVAPSERLDPKAAAFERERAEAEERRRHAEAVAASLLSRHHPPTLNSQHSTLNSHHD